MHCRWLLIKVMVQMKNSESFCILLLFTEKATKLKHNLNEKNWDKKSGREVEKEDLCTSHFLKQNLRKKLRFKILQQFKVMAVNLRFFFFVQYKMSKYCIYFPRPVIWFNDMKDLHVCVTRRLQVYCRFDTDDMAFASTLIWYYHTQIHTSGQ